MRTNNSSPGKPGSMPQGAQTVSIGNKQMMTYIPNGEGGRSSVGSVPYEQLEADEQVDNATKDFNIINSKLAPSINREESLDDAVFDASLDALLHFDSDDDVAPPFNNMNEGGQGRKRKASNAFLTDICSLGNNSSECSIRSITAAAAAVASSLQQQEAETATLQSAAAAGTAAAAAPNNLALSTQGSLIQLPPSLLFHPQAQAASSGNPTTALSGQMTNFQQLQQQQRNTLESNLMKTIALFPGATTAATNNNVPMLGGANQASGAAPATNTAANAFDNLFGFNSIPELPVAFNPAPTKPAPTHPFPTVVESTTTNALIAPVAASALKQPEGYQTTAGGTTTASATSKSFTDASSSGNPKKKSKKSATQQQKRAAKPSTVKSSSTSSNLFVSEDEQERQRRSIRNIREQERSRKFAQRVVELGDLLTDAGVQHKTDRYSTLVGVVNYVKMLQRRSKKLDEEHKVLLKTISGAGEMVNGSSTFGGLPPPPPRPLPAAGTTTVQTFDVSGENSSSISSDRDHTDEELMVFVQGIDYRFIFTNCGVALAIVSVDGRFVDCNEEWLRLTGYSRKELMGESTNSSPPARGDSPRSTSTSVASTAAHAPPASVKSSSFPPSEILIGRQHLSLFNLLGREDMTKVYTAMIRMLGRAPPATRTAATSSASSSSDPNTSDSFLESSSGNEATSGSEVGNLPPSASNERHQHCVDHWAGKVEHNRRKGVSLQLNISLVRFDDGRAKFFNCALSEAN